MKISRIILSNISMPLVSHFETSFGRIYARDCILLEVHAGGWVGYGECVADRDPGYSSETTGTSWHILREFLTPMLLGQEFTQPWDFWPRFETVRGNLMAKAGLEMALWDLLGKARGQSVKDMLGGERDRVDVGVSVGLQDLPEALVSAVQGYVGQGYRRVKD